MELASTFDLVVLDAGVRWEQHQHDLANKKNNVPAARQAPEKLTQQQMLQMLASVKNKETTVGKNNT